jgi:hypothetical protein
MRMNFQEFTLPPTSKNSYWQFLFYFMEVKLEHEQRVVKPGYNLLIFKCERM